MLLHFFFLFLISVSLTNAASHHPSVTVTAAAPGPAASTTPADAPPPNIIAIMSKKGCKTFADLLTAGTGDAAKTFTDSIDGGLTVFCPSDDAMKSFLPKFKNLTADAKTSLLLYHGVPVYYSLTQLKSSNGVMNTLATDGVAKNFNFTVQNSGEMVTVKSGGNNVANIKSTVVDKEPLAVYEVDEVLEPVELFKPAEVPAPAPAPDVVADAPEAGKGKKKKGGKSAVAPAGPEEQPKDQKAADESAGMRSGCGWMGLVVGLGVGVILVV